MKTIDGGDNWWVTETGDYYYNSICFADEAVGFVCGNQGIMAGTTNSGNSWATFNTNTDVHLYDICFVSSQVGYVAGGYPGEGTILKTTDGGNTWNSMLNDGPEAFFGISFPDPLIGYVVGLYGTIMKTQDGGVTWTQQISKTTRDLMDIYFTDINHGYAVGAVGTILYTNNGGDEWYSYSPMCGGWLESVFFTEERKGYFVGSKGIVLTTPEKEFLVSINESNLQENPIKIYPNPAKDRITIETEPGLFKTVIQFFNLNGQEVFIGKTNNHKSTKIDVSMLPQGLYIIKITNSTRVYFQKFIIQ